MVMTTAEARKTLTILERLIGVLEQRQGGIDADERRLLQRLVDRRSTLHQLVAAREAEREKKIVDFALWRDDALPVPFFEAAFGATAV
jgi:hypothetical protein